MLHTIITNHTPRRPHTDQVPRAYHVAFPGFASYEFTRKAEVARRLKLLLRRNSTTELIRQV